MKNLRIFKALLVIATVLLITVCFSSCSKKDDNTKKDDSTDSTDNTISNLPAEGSMKGTIDGKSVEMRYTVAYNLLAASTETQKVFAISGQTADQKYSVTVLFYNTDISEKDYPFGLDFMTMTGVEVTYIDATTPSVVNGVSSDYTVYQGNLSLDDPTLDGTLTISGYSKDVSIAGTINADVQNLNKTKTIKLANINFSAKIYKDENSLPTK
jgi:hypothetical protein